MASREIHITFDGTLAACELWQTRPEFDELCDWWNSGAAGVISLVGPGGSGKTAILERFVRLISPDAIQHEEVEARTIRDISQNGGIFVTSLDRDADPRLFTGRIYAWLSKCYNLADPEQTQVERTPHISGAELCEKIRKSKIPVLIVLDGIEAIQALEGNESEAGRIVDQDIREVLSQIASGNIRNAAAIVTSRYLLSDFLWKHYSFYRYIGIKALPADQCVALLKQRGVVGTAQELQEIADSCGYHAFTVSLSGQVVAERYDGVAAYALAAGLPALIRGTQSRASVGLKFQSERFRNILDSYRIILKNKHRASHDILERLSQFKHGASENTLAEILIGNNWLDRRRRRNFAGPFLPYLTAKKLTAAIDVLCTAQLVHRSEDGRVIVHRAIGDSIALHLDKDASRDLHIRICKAMNKRIPLFMQGLIGIDRKAISEVGGATSFAFLSMTIGSAPKDSYTLDCMEEYMHHAMLAGLWREAWRFYWRNMLGYLSLGLRSADFGRGYRICRLFWSWPYPTAGNFVCDFDQSYEAAYINEWGLYLAKLGMTSQACAALQRAVYLLSSTDAKKSLGICLTNLSYVEYQRGELRDALSHAKEAVNLFDHGEGDHFLSLALVQRLQTMLGVRNEEELEPVEAAAAAIAAWRKYASRVVTYSSIGDPSDNSSTVSRAQTLPVERPRRIIAVFPYFLYQLNDLELQIPDDALLKDVRDVGSIYMELIEKELGSKSPEMMMANLMLSKIMLLEKNYEPAAKLAREVHNESCVNTYPEMRCLSLLALAQISYAEIHNSASIKEEDHAAALRYVRDAKNIALESGFGTAYLACLLEEGFGALLRGQFGLAHELSQRVLGHHSLFDDDALSFPISSACDERCQYRLAILRARLLYVEAAIGSYCKLFENSKILIDDTVDHEHRIRDIRKMLALWQQDAEMSYDALVSERLTQVSRALDNGFIETRYPINPTPIPEIVSRPKIGPSPMLQSIVDIGIVVALQEEFEEIFTRIKDRFSIVVDPTTKQHFYIFDAQRRDGRKKTTCAVVCMGDMGLEAAALVTERLISLLNPSLVVNIGIAGGISHDVSLGDIVVASQVDNYLYRTKAKSNPQPGDGSFSFEFGGEVYMSPLPLIRTIKNLRFSRADAYAMWQERCEQNRRDLDLPLDRPDRISAIVGHIASGPILSATADYGRWLKTRNRNTLAVEMEAAGVMKAVLDRVESAKTLVLRGISDYGDERKSELDGTSSGGYRRIAMKNAVDFLELLIESQVLD